jgi:hypothetical protein
MNSQLLVDTAILQIESLKLADVKDKLTEVSDLQMYNSLAEGIARFVSGHVSSGEIPSNPLAFIGNFFSKLSDDIENHQVKIDGYLDFGHVVLSDKPSLKIDSIYLNKFEEELAEEETIFATYIEELREEVISQHQLICTNSDLPANQQELTIADLIFSDEQLVANNLVDIICYLKIPAALSSIKTFLRISHGGKILNEDVRNHFSKLKSSIAHHRNQIENHACKLQTLIEKIRAFMTVTTTEEYSCLVANGKYSNLPYEDIESLIEQHTAPIDELRNNAIALRDKLESLSCELELIEQTGIKSLATGKFQELQAKLAVLREKSVDFRIAKPKFLLDLDGTEFRKQYDSVQSQRSKELVTIASDIDRRIRISRKRSCIKFFWIGFACVLATISVLAYYSFGLAVDPITKPSQPTKADATLTTTENSDDYPFNSDQPWADL